MQTPPFRANAYVGAVRPEPADSPLFGQSRCCAAGAGTAPSIEPDDHCAAQRVRLSDLDSHLHCSVIGTCLTAAELRKLMARFIDVADASDLEVHHEAVRLASQHAEASRTLHKALDRRHEATLQRYARAVTTEALQALWDEALRQGDVPGAYWAVLTHRRTTGALRQRVFGEVHMLSHLMGASHRADLRRLAALEQDNAELEHRLTRQHDGAIELARERDDALASAQSLAAQLAAARGALHHQAAAGDRAADRDEVESLCAAVALQTERRECAEQQATAAVGEQLRLAEELERLRDQVRALHRELALVEQQLRADAESVATPSALALRGRRVLYVGGRPSSMPAVRDLVLRHGGEFQRHDGGLEDRKGLLASAVAWAQCVVFPVDCVDHDSALALKRLCSRQGTPFVVLRSASVTSFVAGLATLLPHDDGTAESRAFCLKHG